VDALPLIAGLDLEQVPSPCFIVDQAALRCNLAVLDGVQRRTGCRILLALKGYAMFRTFPLIRRTLHGICASGLLEARLGRETFDREVHVYSAAFSPADMDALVKIADHVTFNSFAQWQRFRSKIAAASRPIRCGIRINPAHSEGTVPIYDPCGPGSRLGVLRRDFQPDRLDGISGLLFHTLCEQNADALERTLAVVERDFGAFLNQMDWVNFGGGHHITRADYDIDLLCRLIDAIQKRYGVQVYLEPGEAVALNAGVMVATVLDIIHNDMPIAILDTSAAAHMPDVLEMPYRPEIVGAGRPDEKPHAYRLGGLSCLAGDVIGEYAFDAPLTVGSRLVFLDMAHYSMVKTNTFNGVALPTLALYDSDSGNFEVVRTFGYEDYRMRLS